MYVSVTGAFRVPRIGIIFYYSYDCICICVFYIEMFGNALCKIKYRVGV